MPRPGGRPWRACFGEPGDCVRGPESRSNRPMKSLAPACGLALAMALTVRAQIVPPAPVQGDAVLRDFRFASGEALPELKLHYATRGRELDDGRGHTVNAVLVLHGTGGSSAQFLGPKRTPANLGPRNCADEPPILWP